MPAAVLGTEGTGLSERHQLCPGVHGKGLASAVWLEMRKDTGSASLTSLALTSTEALGKLLRLLIVLQCPHPRDGNNRSACLRGWL